MKYFKDSFKILAIAVILLLAFFACSPENEIEYRLSSETPIISPGQTLSLTINAYEDENLLNDVVIPEDFTYSIIEGGTYVTIDETSGEITASLSTPEGTIVKIIFGNGIKSSEITLTVQKIAVTSVILNSSESNVDVGSSLQINGVVSPDNATYNSITYQITTGSEYAAIDGNGLVTVNNNAIKDEEIVIEGTADGVTSDPFILTISTIPVTDVEIFDINQLIRVSQGGTLDFESTVLPVNASYPTVMYSILLGNELATINSSTGVLNVLPSTAAGAEITVIATADGVSSDPLQITVDQLIIEGTTLTSTRYNVEINGSTELNVELLPYDVSGFTVCYEISVGANYANLDNNTLTIMSYTPSGAVLSIVAYLEDNEGEIENSRSNVIEISVYKIQVTSVEIYSPDNTESVAADATIAFNVNVYPANATEKTPQYIITSGANYATVDRYSGVVTVFKNNEDGEVNIVALVDSVYSNSFHFTTAKYYHVITPSTWSIFDYNGTIFSSYRNIQIDIKDFPEYANLTTIFIPNSVKRLILVGAYSEISPVTTKDLLFYFNKAGSIDITLRNVGIEITSYNASNILDFPENSIALINIEGNCLLHAGRAINPYSYSVDGVYDSEDNNFLYRKNGMDGYNAANGGIAISGYSLEFIGTGALLVKGGDGASGSIGGDGADVPAGSPELSISGNGGNGGSGGDAGYGIYAYNITFNMNNIGIINAYSGKAGRGGEGGDRGLTIVGSSYGINGTDGINGNIVSAIAAYNNFTINTGNIYQTSGVLDSSGWTAPPIESINEMILRMESTYGLDMHVKTDLYNPYNIIGATDYYPMTTLTDDNSVLFMLRIIDNVLSKYPDNMFREIRSKSNKLINIYVVNTIKSGTIAGLAANASSPPALNIWLAYSTANIRNIFYSDVENFAFHEITHIVMYNASSSFSESTVRSFNSSYNYVSSGSPTDGLYNPDNGYTKTNSYFLSSYSRRNWSEDVCETLSLISRQSRDWDFLDTNAPIRAKMLYIASAIDNGYETCSFYKTEYWERFL